MGGTAQGGRQGRARGLEEGGRKGGRPRQRGGIIRHLPGAFARYVEDTAIFLFAHFARHRPKRAGTGYATRDRISTPASERFLRRGLRRSNPAAGSGGTGPRDRRRTKTIHFGGDFRDSGRPSVRQSRREARGSNRPPPLPNRPRLCGPPAALHFPTPGARNRFWRLVTSPRHRLRAGQTAKKNLRTHPPARIFIV